MKKKYFLFMLCILALLFFACKKNNSIEESINPDDVSLAKVLIDGKLRVGVDISHPPMSFSDTIGYIKGFDIDILSAVAEFMDIEVEFIEIDWQEKTTLLNNNTIDCIASGFSITPEREKLFELTIPYFRNAQIIVIRNGDGIRTLDDLKGRRAGSQYGTIGMDILEKYMKDIFTQIKGYNETTLTFSELQNRNIDACITDLSAAAYLIKHHANSFAILETGLASDYYAYAFKKGSIALKNEIEAALMALEEDGTLEKISRKWFDSNIIILGK